MLWRVGRLPRRHLTDKAPKISIGGISAQLRTPANPELVPRGYADYLSQVERHYSLYLILNSNFILKGLTSTYSLAVAKRQFRAGCFFNRSAGSTPKMAGACICRT